MAPPEITREEGWNVAGISGDSGGIGQTDTIRFDASTGKVTTDPQRAKWHNRPFSGSGPATGALSDGRSFTASVVEVETDEYELRCSIRDPLSGASEPGKLRKKDDDDDGMDGESGGWTAVEGDNPIDDPPRRKRP